MSESLPTDLPSATPTNPDELTLEDEMDIIGVALVMIMPFLLIPAFILMFRSTKKILKWFKTQSHGRRVERYIDAELSWVAKMNDRIRHAFEMSWLGRYWNMLQAYFTIASLIFYIVGTYTRRIAYAAQVLQALQTLCAFFFMVDYILLMLVAQDRLKYYFSIYSIIDLLSIMPAFTHFFMPPSLIGLNLFEVILVLPSLRILRFDRILYFTQSQVQRDIGLLMLPFLSLMFLSASVINAIQAFYDANNVPGVPADVGQFHDALYFIVVTMSTVGYGDVSPQHTVIRMIMMCLIVIFIIMLPIYTGKLVEVLSKRATPYEAEYSEPVSQFVVMGSFNYDGAVVLMRELLNNLADGGRSKILVMSTDPAPSEELKNFIDLAYFRKRITYLRGSPLVEDDLRRCHIAQAKAIFIIAATTMDDSMRLSEAAVSLYSSTVKHYTPETPVFVQLHTNDIKSTRMMESCERILCIEELKMAILGRTCVVPGTLTLVTNLFSSFRLPNETAPSRWLEEYTYGSCQTILTFPLPRSFEGDSFSSAALAIFADHGAILIGVKRGKSDILLAPGVELGYTIKRGDVGFVICNEAEPIPADYYDIGEANVVGGIGQNEDSGTAFAGAGIGMGEDSNVLENVPLQSFSSKSAAPLLINDPFARKGSTGSSSNVTKGSSIHTNNRTSDIDAFDIDTTFDTSGHLRGGSTVTVDSSIAQNRTSTSSEPALFEDILSHPIQEGEFDQHVIVCGLSLSLVSLVRPLRSTRLKRKQPVVVVSEYEPDPDLWAELESLGQVYFVLGAPRMQSVLRRAGITTCSSIIILLDKAMSASDYDHTMDAEVVYVSRLAAELNPNANVVAELVHYAHLMEPAPEDINDRIKRMRADWDRPDLPQRVRYTHMQEWKRERGIDPDNQASSSSSSKKAKKEQTVEYNPDGTRYVREVDRSASASGVYEPATNELDDVGMVRSFPSYHFNPYFASGSLYCPMAANTLLFAEYYKPYLIEIVDQLLSMTELEGSAHLFVKPVPDSFVNTSYLELTSHLLRHGIVPVALYRPAELHGNSQPYVYTNPKRLARLAEGDRVLILAPEEPSSIDDKALTLYRQQQQAKAAQQVK